MMSSSMVTLLILINTWIIQLKKHALHTHDNDGYIDGLFSKHKTNANKGEDWY